MRVWVVYSRTWHPTLVDAHVERVVNAIAEADATVLTMPHVLPEGAGIYELPQDVALRLTAAAPAQRPHAILAFGVVLQGQSKHDDDVAYAAAHGLLQLGFRYSIPVVWGVVHAPTLAVAEERTTGVTGAASAISYAKLALTQAKRYMTAAATVPGKDAH